MLSIMAVVSSLKGGVVIRDDAHIEETHLSPLGPRGVVIQGRQTWEECWPYRSHSWWLGGPMRPSDMWSRKEGLPV